MVKIIHTADLHLDAPFSARSAMSAQAWRRMQLAAFTSALLFAKSQGTQIFIISGDLFDSCYVSRETKDVLIKEFEALPDCRFFISPGNHDPINEASPYKMMNLPPNVHVFSEVRECVEIPELGADVYGVGFTASVCKSSNVAGYHIKNHERVNILVCHGDLENNFSDSSPITRKEIGASGFDYVALGHIHKRTEMLCENGVFYSYPGCLLGRGFDECGKKGLYYGAISKGEVALSFRNISANSFEKEEIDVSDCAGKLYVLERIKSVIKSYPEQTAMRVILTGRTSDTSIVHPSELTGQGTPQYIEVVDKRVFMPKLDEYSDVNSLKGIFYRRMDEKLSECEPESEEFEKTKKAMLYGLMALEGSPVDDLEGY